MSVFLMRGKIGAGKSYRARQICAENGAVLLSMDAVMEAAHGNACIGRDNHLRAEAGLLTYFLDLTRVLHSKGISVVIDHGFWTKTELSHATDYLDANGIPYTVVLMEADFETRLGRVQDRKDGKPFTKEKLIRFDGYFED